MTFFAVGPIVTASCKAVLPFLHQKSLDVYDLVIGDVLTVRISSLDLPRLP